MTAQPRRTFLRSTTFRLAAAITGLSTMAMLVAFLASYWLIAQDLRQWTKDQIEDETEFLVASYRTQGLNALIAQLQAHALIESGETLYFYTGQKHKRHAGNAIFKHPFVGWRSVSESALIATDGVRLDQDYLALGTRLGKGTLILARSTNSIEDVQRIFAAATLWGLGIALVLVMVGAAAFARRAETRIRGIARTLDEVAAGELDRRVPQDASSPGDDLDRVAASINAMLGQLSKNVASLKQVSADVAHDLKTPIQRLRSTLEGIRREPELAQRIEAVIDEAVEQSDQIVQTFQALLRIAQIEGGSPRTRFRPTDMVELVEAVAEAFQPAVEEAGHRFVSEIEDGTVLTVEGDRDLLAQMLSNLLTNAIRHAPPPADIAFAARATQDRVLLTVSDTGPGIPPEERDRVFRRLYRLERSRTTEGSGLGLSMAQAIAELHGGEIRLEANAPGLKAIVSLPRLAN